MSRVRIPVTREDHGTEVRCEVRHEALPEDKILMEAANLNIHCKYPSILMKRMCVPNVLDKH